MGISLSGMESTFQPKTNVQPIITQAPRIVRARRCVSLTEPPSGQTGPRNENAALRRLRGHAPEDERAAPRRLPAGSLRKQQSRPEGGSRGARRGKAREPPVGSAASYPPEGFPLSTFGDGGLNCRVRDGTGCAPSSMAADPTGGSCESSLAGGHPGGQHSAQDVFRSLRRQHEGRV